MNAERGIILPEPYKNKVIEPIKLLPPEERKIAIERAGYNTFLLTAEDVFIDLLTDSGTSAQSQKQKSASEMGDESYAGATSWFRLEKAVQDVYGFKEVIPTHQGRAGEHLVAQNMISPGLFVLKNEYFTTTRAHIEKAGGIFTNVITPQAFDPQNEFPFKGNVDLAKTETFIKEHGPESIAMFWIEGNVNMVGGQPFSMENLRSLRELSLQYHIPLILDATRALENAYFIKTREPGYADKPVGEILKEIMSYADGCTMSSKKDNLVPIGGFVAVNDADLARKLREMLVLYEGFPTYGGMSGSAMEVLAQGIREMIDDDYIRFRIEQVQRFGQYFIDAGVPIILPIGGHAVELDAAKILPNMDRERYPAQALAAAIYLHSGVRTMERGIVSAGRDPKTGKNDHSHLEMVRLTVPRRVYSDRHLEYVARSIIDLVTNYRDMDLLQNGLEFTYEPEKLRFFMGRFRIANLS